MMKFARQNLLLFLLSIWACPTAVIAAPTAVVDAPQGYPRVTAILGLNVSGTTLDVAFHSGQSYNQLFATSTPYFLGNPTGASAARNAIVAVLNGVIPPGTPGQVSPTLSQPPDALGTFNTAFFVPFLDNDVAAPGTPVRTRTGGSNEPSTMPAQAYSDSVFEADYVLQDRWAYATFTVVPEPTALALGIVGLLAIGGVRARRLWRSH